MADVYTPTVRSRRLALELRLLRDRAGMNLSEASGRLGWNKNRLNRIEAAKTRPTDEDVTALLQLYGHDLVRHDAIIQLNRDAWQRGWWTHYGSAFTGSYPMLESQAGEIWYMQTGLVPGLFQTPEYAQLVIAGLRPGLTSEEIDERVSARLARRAILSRTSPPKIHVIIDEVVTRRSFGHPEILRKQVFALAEAAVERPNVTIQVIPIDGAVHAGAEGSFTLFLHPDHPGLDVGHAEWLMGQWYAESAEELTRLRMAFACASDVAMTPEESTEFLVASARE